MVGKIFSQVPTLQGLIFKLVYPLYKVKSKVGDHSRGWPEGSLFDSLLHQGVGEGATPFPGYPLYTNSKQTRSKTR